MLSGDIAQDDLDPDGNDLAESVDDIQGTNSLHVVSTQDLSVAPRVDGFFVKAGDADGSGDEGRGGGWLNLDGSPEIARVYFMGNRAAESGGRSTPWAVTPPWPTAPSPATPPRSVPPCSRAGAACPWRG